MDFNIALRRGFLVLFCLGGMGATTACGKSYSWNQKLTVEVETPDGIKTGSSVIEVTLTENKWGTPEMRGVSATLRGEAVSVEVAPKQYLFALLDKMPYASSVYFPKTTTMTAAKHLRQTLPARILAADQYPTLVISDNVNDPSSMKRARSIGKNYKVKSMSISISDAGPSFTVINSLLPWISNNPSRYVRNEIDNSFESRLRHGWFVQR